MAEVAKFVFAALVGAPGWCGFFSYELFHQVLQQKMAQGMTLDEARASLLITNGNMRKRKHNGACIATSIHNLTNAWTALGGGR